jgi:uncharacterized protein
MSVWGDVALATLVASFAPLFSPAAACEVMGPASALNDTHEEGSGKSEFNAEAQAVLDAASTGNWAAMTALLPDCAPSPSAKAGDGSTMLQWALANKKAKAIPLLLRAGVDPAQVGKDGRSAIHDAASLANPKWLSLLLDGKANPNARHGATGSTPLVEALRNNRDKHFEILLKAGADPKLADRTGNTPLHVAAQLNKPWHAYMMLTNAANPADPFLLNAQGQNFQKYLFMTKDRLLTADTRKARQVVLDYLWFKEIPIDPSAPPRKNEGRDFKP